MQPYSDAFIGLGLTLGYGINDNLNITFCYKSTVNDSDPKDLRTDGFMVSLVCGWRPLIKDGRVFRFE
jgi:hypothetical protein